MLGSGSVRVVVLAAAAVALLIVAAPASAEPAIWEPDFGAQTSVSDDDDETTQNEDETLYTVPFDFELPAYGTVQEGDLLDISSNGNVELVGDELGGEYYDQITFTNENAFPILAPFFADLDPEDEGDVFYNEFDDDTDGTTDRFVVTWDTTHNDCNDSVDAARNCVIRAQVQVSSLYGGVIFGYDTVDLDSGDPTSEVEGDVLVGIGPGCQDDGSGGCLAPPDESDFTADSPFSSGDQPFVYELFEADPGIPAVDLAQRNICFLPNGPDGWSVEMDCAGGSSGGGSDGGGGDGGAAVENCADGADNDGDGQIDAADPDCPGTGAANPVVPVIPGLAAFDVADLLSRRGARCIRGACADAPQGESSATAAAVGDSIYRIVVAGRSSATPCTGVVRLVYRVEGSRTVARTAKIGRNCAYRRTMRLRVSNSTTLPATLKIAQRFLGNSATAAGTGKTLQVRLGTR